MKLRKVVIVGLAAALLAGMVGSPGVAAKKKKPAGPVVVGTDNEGDWGENSNIAGTPAQALGGPLSQDLLEAALELDGDVLNFIITVTELPPNGGVPEFTRYSWDFNVDGDRHDIDGKWTNYTRGACDPTSGQCPPPRDPGMQPFIVRGDCTVEPIGAINLTVCQELGVVQGIFDTEAGTITVPVPLEMIGAKPGTKIEPSAGTFGAALTASPAAFVTNATMPMDLLQVMKTFVIPGKKKKGKK